LRQCLIFDDLVMRRSERFGRQDEEYGSNRQHHEHHDAQHAPGSVVNGRSLSE
jgi:hypothetical protein